MGTEYNLTDYFSKQLLSGTIDKSALALICESTLCQLTFGELHLKSNILAQIIKQFIIKENGCNEKSPDGNIKIDIGIGVRINPSIDLVICIFAILKCGAAYVPIGSGENVPVNRMTHIVQNCKPIGIISDFEFKVEDAHALVHCPVWSIKQLWTLSNNIFDITLPSRRKSDEDTAVIMYTSGSTGVPKGASITHRTIFNRLLWQWTIFPFHPDEKCCLKTSITFGDSVAEIFGPLLYGVPLVIYSLNVVSHPDLLLQSLTRHQITRIVLVPSLLQSILDTLKLIVLDSITYKRKPTFYLNSLTFWNVTICNFYGSTELTFDVTYEVFNGIHDLDKLDVRGKVPIGKPLWNAQLYILDKKLKQVQNGQVGELFVGGEQVLAKGYVENGFAKSDKFKFVPLCDKFGKKKSIRLFQTGDLVQMLQALNGSLNLFYIGRNDNQVKVRGHRVDLSEIKSAIVKTEMVLNCDVVCFEPGTFKQEILAFIVIKNKIKIKDVQTSLEILLENYQMPLLIRIPSIPMLVNGKVDKQQLLKFYKNKIRDGKIENWTNFPIEDNDLSRDVIYGIANCLNVPSYHVVSNLEDSFYSIGGTSLNTITVILMLRENGIHISISDFIRMSSVAQLINHIQINQRLNAGEKLIPQGDDLNLLRLQYAIKPLSYEHKDYLMSMICYGDANKGALELLVNVTEQDVGIWLSTFYDFYVECGLSFIVERLSDGKIVASALNHGFLANGEPEFKPHSKNLGYIFELLTAIDASQKEFLPRPLNKIFRSGSTNTSKEMNQNQNVGLMTLVEEHNIIVAKKMGFVGIISTNLSFLSQQIVRDVLNYHVLLDIPVNQFESQDGTRPFQAAKDEQRAICCFKSLEN